MRDFLVNLRNKIWYAALMAFLALVSGGMLAYEFFGKVGNMETIKVMTDLDLGIAYVFLADFVLAFFFAQHRLTFLKENWLDLLGSIPFSDGLFRAMRILRFVRLVRLLRVANAGLNIQGSLDMMHKGYKRRNELKQLRAKQEQTNKPRSKGVHRWKTENGID